MADGQSLVHRWFAAGDAGNFAAFDEYLHPDVVVHAPLGFATKGIEAERDAWKRAVAGVPDLHHEIQALVETGSTIAVRVVVTGTHLGEFVGVPATGRRFSIDQATFVTVREGKVSEAWEIADTALLLEQLGRPQL